FWPHARASLRLAGISERHATARRALRWIRASGLEEVSLLNIRREALAHTLDEVGTNDLLDGLEKAGWLQQTPRTAGAGPGTPPAGELPPCFKSQKQEMQKLQNSIPTAVTRHRRRLFLQFLQFLHPHPRPNQRVTASTSPTSSTAGQHPGRPATGWMTSGDAS